MLAIFHFLTPTLRAQDFDDLPFWRQGLGGAVIGRPVAQVESVVAVTDGGNLRSYSSRGTLLWDYYAGGRLSPHVSRSREGTSYISRTNGLLIAVNRAGRELWTINLGLPLVCPVLIGWDGRLFVFSGQRIVCLTASGYTLWSRTIEKKLIFDPLMDSGGGVIAVFEDGEVLNINAFGNVSSSIPLSKIPPVAAASLEIDGPAILLLYADRHLELIRGFDSGGSEPPARVELPSSPLAVTRAVSNEAGIGGAAVGGAGKDNAAVLLADGRVIMLSLEKMETLWIAASHIQPGELNDSSAGNSGFDFFCDERGVYVLTKNGATGFARDGSRLWTMYLKGAAAVPSFGDDGILYSGGLDWILYAYRLENRERPVQRLLYGEKPMGNYGTGHPELFSYTGYYYRFEERELERHFSEIRGAITDGIVGAREKEYAKWLMESSGCLMANPPYRSINLPPVHIQHRMEAARLLGYIGSRETIPFLAELFAKDPELLVKAAAAEAIGRIGVDPEGIALRAFERFVFPPLPGRDEALLTSIAAATGALCRFSGPPLSEAGIKLLTFLSGIDKPSGTVRQAQREIRSLNDR